MKIRVIDIETTGIDPITSNIIEIGSIDLMDGEIGYAQECLVALEGDHTIAPEAMAVHHITPMMLENAPHYDDVIDVFYSGDVDVMVAHNAKFEQGFLPSFDPWICTYKVAIRLWPDAPSHSNQALRYWKEIWDLPGDIYVKHAHRALYDAVTTAMLLRLMLKESTIEQMIEWSSKSALLPKMRFGKHKGDDWNDIPDGYLKWMINQSDMDEDATFTAKYELERRANATT